MKPAKFLYFCPESKEEVIALLTEYGDEAKLLAGGQSLVPLMNLRMARPEVLIDINRLPGLREASAEDGLRLGALVSHAAVGRSEVVLRTAPLLTKVAPYIGHAAIRTRGTIGGSVAHADPAAEWPVALLALDARIVARGETGDRVVPLEDFFDSYFTTTLLPTELLTEVRLPSARPNTLTWFSEVARRSGDYAQASAALVVEKADDGTCRSAAISLGGVSEVPVRASEAERSLVGARLDDTSAIAEAARLATRDLTPAADFHATGPYKRRVAEVLVRRGLTAIGEGGQRA